MADEELSIEDNILNSIGEGDDTNDEQSTVIEGEAQEVPTETAPTEAQQPDGTSESVATEQAESAPRGPQDLVDGQGNLVAKGGKERRFYETAQRERQRADTLEREINTLRTKVDAFEGTGNLPNQYNLSSRNYDQVYPVAHFHYLRCYCDQLKFYISYLNQIS